MKYTTVSSLCEGIAESIRRKEGSTEKINPQDFVQRIDNLQVGGGTSESNIEYLDVSGLEGMQKHYLVLFADRLKLYFPNEGVGNMIAGAKFAGVTYAYMDMVLDSSFDMSWVKAITIDFSTVVSQQMQSGDAMIGPIKDMLPKMGITQEQLDSIPRITKEQFYTLE